MANWLSGAVRVVGSPAAPLSRARSPTRPISRNSFDRLRGGTLSKWRPTVESTGTLIFTTMYLATDRLPAGKRSAFTESQVAACNGELGVIEHDDPIDTREH